MRETVAGTKVDAVLAAEELGFPVVMKVVGPVHKSDAGGVAPDVADSAQVSAEFERMMKINGATAILIQPMLQGTELFAGVKREGVFGHLILGGMGGIFVEALRDVSFRVIPIVRRDAAEMIKEIKGYSLLQGYRGQESAHLRSLQDILLKVSALVERTPVIKEIDLNPVFAYKDSALAVDARIVLEDEAS